MAGAGARLSSRLLSSMVVAVVPSLAVLVELSGTEVLVEEVSTRSMLVVGLLTTLVPVVPGVEEPVVPWLELLPVVSGVDSADVPRLEPAEVP